MRLRTKSVINLEAIRGRGSQFVETSQGKQTDIPLIITQILKTRERMALNEILVAIHRELGHAFALPTTDQLRAQLAGMSENVVRNTNGTYTLVESVTLR